ncbi:unnamed protein product [Ilex paraguariensis]|uniref:Transcription factor TFIIB cyclin-like domain-containing protein n=1 Tax=Ilex paraguariensis TaxID=185542 RepID=A0ABC8QRT0_9AQUA
MLYCSYCAKNVEPAILDGSICCSECGKVIILNSFTDEPTFLKDSAGLSQLSGNFVKTVQSEDSVSRGRILRDAQIDMASMAYAMEVDGGDSVLMPASKFYRIAVERNFTRGRRKEQVEAACLYISCRYNKKPFLLIDFSEHLRINVYVLGAVFLQLCKLLSLEEHSIVQKPVDPSLFIHRFSERRSQKVILAGFCHGLGQLCPISYKGLLGGRNAKVERTALRIIASMKRDWMQTGRKPSGLCGAALYVSALSHGLKCSKSDVEAIRLGVCAPLFNMSTREGRIL